MLRTLCGRSQVSSILRLAAIFVILSLICPIAGPVGKAQAQATSAQFLIGQNVYVVDGVALVMDASSFMRDGRTFVPVRYLAMALGIAEDKILWNPTNRTVILDSGSTKLRLVIGDKTLLVNEQPTTMDVAPVIQEGRTYLPARFVAEALGYQVAWNQATQAVVISRGTPSGGDLTTLASAISRHVVAIDVFDSNRRLVGSGSGVAVAKDLVLTNAHVVESASWAIITDHKNTRSYAESVVARNEDSDLALLKVKGSLEPAEIGDSNTIKIGARVVAVGNPLGLLQGTVSDGIVSGLRNFTGRDFIQTTAPISPGSSGGGLFDVNGRLVGITMAQFTAGQNLNLAVPINAAKPLLATSSTAPGQVVIQPKVYRIGVVAPLSGEYLVFGESVKKGVGLLTNQTNEKGGISGRKIELRFADDANQPDKTLVCVENLVKYDQAVAVIGSVASKCTIYGAQVAQVYKVPLITPTSTNESVTPIGDYIFRACFIDRLHGAFMARFAVQNLQAKTAACLFNEDEEYCRALAESFRATFENLGGSVVEYQTYRLGADIWTQQLRSIRAVKPDVVFLPDYYNAAALIAKQARSMQIDSVFLGGDGWDSPDLVSLGGEAVEGAFFSNHYAPYVTTEENLAFLSSFRKAYGAEPDALAALAYEAALLLFSAIQDAENEGTSIKDALISQSVKGLAGPISFEPNSRNPIKSAVIMRVTNGVPILHTVVEP